jgi:hypothetical protein
MANVIESSGLNHVVVNPLPIAPAGPATEDVRPSKEFCDRVTWLGVSRPGLLKEAPALSARYRTLG